MQITAALVMPDHFGRQVWVDAGGGDFDRTMKGNTLRNALDQTRRCPNRQSATFKREVLAITTTNLAWANRLLIFESICLRRFQSVTAIRAY